MSQEFQAELQVRSENRCELCSATDGLTVYEVPFAKVQGADAHAYLCPKCTSQVDGESELDLSHWYCLNESAWTQVPAVQVLAFQMLSKLNTESWAQELLDQMYLEDDVRAWAQEGLVEPEIQEIVSDIPVDSNGTPLEEGDSVVIIKNLDVKGSSMVAKRGTPVRNIRLTDDPTHVEGRVNGMAIFLKTCFLKKT